MRSCYIIQGAQLCDDLEGVGWEGGSGGRRYVYIYIYIYMYIYTHTHLWPMHIIWQKLTQHCKAIILQLKIKNTYKRKNKKRKKKNHCLIQDHQNLYLSMVFSMFMTSWVGIKFLILRVTPFLFKDFVYVSFIWKIYEGFLSDLPFLILFTVKHSPWILLKFSEHSSVLRKR